MLEATSNTSADNLYFVFPVKIQMPLEELVINFSLGISAQCLAQ